MKEDRSRHDCPCSVMAQDMTSVCCSCPSRRDVQYNLCRRASGVAAPGIHLQRVPVSRHQQAELRQLRAACKGRA